MDDDYNPNPVAVYLRLADDPPVQLPGNAFELRTSLDALSDDLVTGKAFNFGGWETIITFEKERAEEVMCALYNGEVPDSLWVAIAASTLSELTLFGYWD